MGGVVCMEFFVCGSGIFLKIDFCRILTENCRGRGNSSFDLMLKNHLKLGIVYLLPGV